MVDLRSLLAEMDAAGITPHLLPGGKQVQLDSDEEPSKDLIEALRVAKLDLIAWLAARERPRTPGEMAEHARRPGHCGSCARYTELPEWGTLMGECSAGRRAHGILDGNPNLPVVIQAAHRCAAFEGRGYKARTTG